MDSKRVVITGIGVVTPIGIGIDEFWKAALESKNGISKIHSFDSSKYTSHIAGEIENNKITKFLPQNKFKKIGRCARFALLASHLAHKDSNIDIHDDLKEKCDVIIGTSSPDLDSLQNHIYNMKENNQHFSDVSLLSTTCLPSRISSEFGVKGECLSLNNGCASGLSAIQMAYYKIKQGRSVCAFAGGVDSGLQPVLFDLLCTARLLSKHNDSPEEASRPFDKQRDGYVISEGAGILFLEEYDNAKKRGARIYAEITGAGISNNGKSFFKPFIKDPEEGITSLKKALKESDIKNNTIDYYCAHGSSSPLMDVKETQMLKKIFKSNTKNIPVSSIKSMIGHPLGASGGIQAAICAKVLENNVIPPTKNYKYKDPLCDLDYVPNNPREKFIRTAATYNSGMGGSNISLVMKKT